MIQISKNANPNYLCKVVELRVLEKHPNADRLQKTSIDFQTVITGLDAKVGDVYVFFPVESKINLDFLSETNSFRDSDYNKDKNVKGFFETNCRVKAVRLRGEKSMGYIVPLDVVADWAKIDLAELDGKVGQEFDTINGLKLVEKYEIKTKEGNTSSKSGRQPKPSRLIGGQVHLHVDTENLRKSVHNISPEDCISITYKTHGTSWWVSHTLVKRGLSVKDKIAKFLGVNISETEYALVYGSRRVIKNGDLGDPKAKDHYFGYDLWEKVKEEVGHLIPKGYTFYGEMLGYDHNGGEIQKDYDYGCHVGQHLIEVYRITRTTPDGLVTEMSHPDIEEFCKTIGLRASQSFYFGKAGDFTSSLSIPETTVEWRERFIKELEETFNEKDCYMCVNKVPEEGVVIRKNSIFNFGAYKLKSFRFLEKESKQLDSGIEDLESIN